ncbi:MAG TPA: c-type cytochrome domain-containing protein [Planctomycetota bacterium]|nr:c-type cytochrome domain-containing protein [Planctomycetota bacterium]
MSAPSFFRRQFLVSVPMLAGIVLSMLAVGGASAIVYLAYRLPPPDRSEKAAPPAAEAVVASSYESVIRPLLDAKCTQCHGEKKQKAGLSLATTELIVKGGRHGATIDRVAPEKSLILARIQLALDEEKHMPPEEEDQLAPAELAALQRWIQAGAPFEGVVEGIDAPVSPIPAAQSESKVVAVAATLAPADPKAIAALREVLVHVQPVSEGSQLLWVDFSATAKSIDDAKAAELLQPLREQLEEVSLARSAVGDASLAMFAKFDALRRLDVRATAIGDAGIAALAAHGKLALLVLAQNKLTDASVDSLIAMTGLRSVHLWRSGISAEGIARLRGKRPELAVDDGAKSASVALEAETTISLTKATPPQAAPASATAAPSFAPVNSKCPVTGAPVKQAYTIVHEGKLIGFCCPECPKEFWADPAKYADRLQ